MTIAKHTAAEVPQLGLPKLGYQPSLDGLRAGAIGLVLLEHSGLEIFDGGRNGVIVFFVLSGFLISKLLIEEWGRTSTIDIKSFYVRRTIRIMPAPLVMIGIMYLLRGQYFGPGEEQAYFVKELIFAGLYITNLRPLWGGVPDYVQTTYLSHTWSLSVEEHFYLVWPWLFQSLRLPARSADNAIRGLLWFAFIIAIVRQLLVVVFEDLVSFSLFSFDGFAIGAALAFALHAGAGQRLLAVLAREWVFWAALGTMALDLFIGSWSHGYSYVYFSYIGIASAAMIGHLVLNREGSGHRLLTLAPVVYIGQISYSLYLWHVPIQAFFSRNRYPDWPVVQILIIEWTLTLVVSMASYHLLERPLVALRKRFSRT